MPQHDNHIIKKNLKVDNKRTVKIVGCGSNIEMTASKLSIAASIIIFQGFKLEAFKDKSQILLQADKISGEQCTFIREEGEENLPFITVSQNAERESQIWWKDNTIKALDTIALRPGVGGWIKNCSLEGHLLLLYDEKFFPLEWNMSEETKPGYEKKLNNMELKTRSSIHIVNNNIEKVITNPGIELDIPGGGYFSDIFSYKNLIVTENVISGTLNSLISDTLSSVNNHFTSSDDEKTAFLLGHTGVIMGNTMVSQAGGIDTLFDTGRKEIAHNIGEVL
jgi:hypothetical protein